jgi:hypothetical protein
MTENLLTPEGLKILIPDTSIDNIYSVLEVNSRDSCVRYDYISHALIITYVYIYCVSMYIHTIGVCSHGHCGAIAGS